MSRDTREAGFTLVEVLVSLAIFSIAIIGLQRAATLALRGTSQLQLRTHAGFVADNAVALNQLTVIEVATDSQQARSGGIDFVATIETTETELPRFFEVNVSVRQLDSDTVIASRRSYRREAPRIEPSVTGDRE